MRALAKSLDPAKQPRTPAKRQLPQTPARRTPGVAARTPGTVRKTPRTGGPTVATPHTARAVKQLQHIGRSGGIRKRNEHRRESERDVLRGLSRGIPPPLIRLPGELMIALASEATTTGTRRVSRRRSESSSLSPPPPDLQSRLSTPSSDDVLQPPRLSLTHDPLAPTREIPRTPTQRNDAATEKDSTGARSVEGARRAPLTRLSDRLSFGVGDEVDDTMMNILANRPVEPLPPLDDDTFEFGDVMHGDFGDDNTLELGAVGDDIEGEYTANLKRLGSPLLLDFEKEQLQKTTKTKKPVQRYPPSSIPVSFCSCSLS